MSSRKQLAVDTNIIMDAVKPDGAEDVEEAELVAARQVGIRLLTENILVYSKSILPEWTSKNLLGPESLLSQLIRQDRVLSIEPVRLNRGKKAELAQYVDYDDQPFVLVAASIDDDTRVLVTRDPKTTKKESRRYVKSKFSVEVKKASEFV